MNPVQRAIEVAHKAAKRLTGVSVTINRDADSASVTAVLLGPDDEQVDIGIAIAIRQLDFLVDVSDYDFGSGPVLPANGDTFSLTLNGNDLTYEVIGDDGVPPWMHHNHYQTVFRIHAKKVTIG